jgi:hypothetical protein
MTSEEAGRAFWEQSYLTTLELAISRSLVASENSSSIRDNGEIEHTFDTIDRLACMAADRALTSWKKRHAQGRFE